MNSLANDALTKVNSTLLELRRLFLVENMLDSIMFGLSLWVLTYIGSWFNAMTLVLISWVGLFTIPKVCTKESSSRVTMMAKLYKLFSGKFKYIYLIAFK